VPFAGAHDFQPTMMNTPHCARGESPHNHPSFRGDGLLHFLSPLATQSIAGSDSRIILSGDNRDRPQNSEGSVGILRDCHRAAIGIGFKGKAAL
jgi:hypothetical protein